MITRIGETQEAAACSPPGLPLKQTRWEVSEKPECCLGISARIA
jgi:hypothetical protein